MKIYDISRPLSDSTIVYPGDPNIRIGRGPKASVSSISMGTHSGTHIDAPRHALARGRGIEVFSFTQYIGPCRVIDYTKVQGGITVAHLEKCKIKKGERILLKTVNSKKGFKKFRSDYTYLTGDAASYLAKRGVALVGIDYLSIKQRGNPDNRAHTELLKRNIVILETIDLAGVSAGKYFLIMLPLAIHGRDGAPARAILIK